MPSHYKTVHMGVCRKCSHSSRYEDFKIIVKFFPFSSRRSLINFKVPVIISGSFRMIIDSFRPRIIRGSFCWKQESLYQLLLHLFVCKTWNSSLVIWVNIWLWLLETLLVKNFITIEGSLLTNNQFFSFCLDSLKNL